MCLVEIYLVSKSGIERMKAIQADVAVTLMEEQDFGVWFGVLMWGSSERGTGARLWMT